MSKDQFVLTEDWTHLPSKIGMNVTDDGKMFGIAVIQRGNIAASLATLTREQAMDLHAWLSDKLINNPQPT